MKNTPPSVTKSTDINNSEDGFYTVTPEHGRVNYVSCSEMFEGLKRMGGDLHVAASVDRRKYQGQIWYVAQEILKHST